MELLHPHCAGLDLHKDTVVACIRHMVDGKATTEVKTFKTTTQQLMELSDWLSAQGVTHIAMEATGVCWKPVWHILCDGEFELVLANAAHVKNLPGRKTDVNDATWLADLMAHGLVRASFVPDEPTQQMRDLLRTRKQFVRERSSHTQRIQKTLEDANIKLDSVITDIVGLSGRRMIEALIAGETAPQALAALAHGRIRATAAEREAALRGRVTPHHRFMLQLHLDHLDAVNAAIARIDKEVDGNAEPFRAAIEMLTTIPGISSLAAEVMVSEIGIDMSRFKTQGHLISWAGICPKSDESAGKRRREGVHLRRSGSRLRRIPEPADSMCCTPTIRILPEPWRFQERCPESCLRTRSGRTRIPWNCGFTSTRKRTGATYIRCSWRLERRWRQRTPVRSDGNFPN